MQNCNALCSVSESNKQNPRDRTLDLPFFFCYKHIPSLKNLPSPAPNESSPYWFQGNFAASFVFNFCLREFLLSAFANRFELRCEPKRLMLLYYKICPCCTDLVECHLLEKAKKARNYRRSEKSQDERITQKEEESYFQC